MKKIAVIVLVLLAVVAGGLVISRNVLAKIVVVKGVKAAAGLDIDIASINLMKSGVVINGLKIYNPQEFSERLLAVIPEVSVDFDLSGLLAKQVHLRSLRIYVGEFNVILNEKGKLNVNSLALLAPKGSSTAKGGGEGKPPEVKIDELNIKIGKVSYKGSFAAAGTKTSEFNLGIDETFHDVTNPGLVAGDIVKKVLGKIGIANFASFDVTGPVEQVKGAVSGAMKSVKGIFVK